ncbi:type II toxin-antitoxin system RelB/DinJ family antitoxin [Fructilactobacillus sp. Tb1]|uniref:type II toxin-antitoxin system RelB/DinJ family antitoxin n=1 Tax=Fructilactobacillus sp. Tb1 TaxID=3422304 RepID=UPI003D2B4C14
MSEEKARVNVRVDKETKEKAAKIYKDLGLDMSTAVNMFLKETVLTDSVPLKLNLNYDENEEARNDVKNGNTRKFKNINEFNDWVDNI